jgi:hypothetical protein
MALLESHSAYLDAWVFTAIGGQKPERRERLLLWELLESADYFNRASISKGELEYGVCDLVTAGLVSVEGNTIALTAGGQKAFDSVWREYESWRESRGPLAAIRRLVTFRLAEDPIGIAERRFKGLACAAHRNEWAVSREEFDAAVARYHQQFDTTFRKLT